MKPLHFFLSFIIIISSCAFKGISTRTGCEKVDFHFDNNLNDNSKVDLIRRFAFDTTANMVKGTIVSRESNQPISNAIVTMQRAKRMYIDTSGTMGEFEIFKNQFSDKWKFTITHPNFRCYTIKAINVGGGIELRLKLSR